MLEIRNIHKSFGSTPVLGGIDLDVNQGDVIAIIGPSGSGKTTLLRCLNYLEHADEGTMVFDQETFAMNKISKKDIARLRKKTAFVFQSYNLFTNKTALKNVTEGLIVGRKMPKEQAREIAMKALEKVGLADRSDAYPAQLSGGQQQRVALARSLAKKPQLLLLDEPLGALDKKLRQRTQFELVNIIESVGVTVVMVTHDQEEAMTMASRIAVMHHGRVLQVGTPKEIYECPINRFVADFIGNVNLFDGQLSVDEPDRCEITTDHGVMHISHGIGGAIGMPLAVAVRPEKIYIAKNRPADVSVNLFSGKVREIAYFGSYTSFVVEAASGRTVVVTEPNGSRLENIDITWEDQVFFWWDEADPVVLTQ